MTTTIAPGTELYRPSPDQLSPKGPLTPAEQDHFFREGYVIARSLVPSELLHQVQKASQNLEESALQLPAYAKLAFTAWRIEPIFKKLATNSAVSAAAAQLTPHDGGRERGLVVLNDAYFKLKPGNIGCNFHVDDSGFWPTKQGEPGPGVNAWIALDDVGEGGGGLAVAPRSFGVDFLDCREAIKQSTCTIHVTAPELSERLESIAVKPVMKAGDVILHTRFLFHRGDPFREWAEGEEGIRRYSVRYMPGEAVVDEVEITVEDGERVFNVKDGVRLEDADVEKFPSVFRR